MMRHRSIWSTASAVFGPRWSSCPNSAPARSASSPPDQGSGRHPRRRHHHRRTQEPPTRSRCPASRKRSRWCSAACSRSMPPISRPARRHGQAAPQRRSFSFEMETSAALGFGFRCGFLGLLHLEIIQERLEREFDLDLITTAPSVVYASPDATARCFELHNPADMPDPCEDRPASRSRGSRPPSDVPDEYLGSVLKLCQDRRGIQKTSPMSAAAPWWSTTCRSTRWCSTSTTA
jgi:hypothetical protein